MVNKIPPIGMPKDTVPQIIEDKNKLEGYLKNASKEEIAVFNQDIKTWGGSGYIQVRELELGKEFTFTPTGWSPERVKNSIYKLINQSEPIRDTLYRGLHFTPDAANLFLREALDSKQIEFKALSSCTKDIKTAGKFAKNLKSSKVGILLEIEPGTRGVDLDELKNIAKIGRQRNEQEVIVSGKSLFSVEDKGNITVDITPSKSVTYRLLKLTPITGRGSMSDCHFNYRALTSYNVDRFIETDPKFILAGKPKEGKKK